MDKYSVINTNETFDKEKRTIVIEKIMQTEISIDQLKQELDVYTKQKELLEEQLSLVTQKIDELTRQILLINENEFDEVKEEVENNKNVEVQK